MEILLLFVFVTLIVALALRGMKDQRVAVRVPARLSRRTIRRR